MQHKTGLVLFLAQAVFCLGLAVLLEFQARNFSLSCPAYLFSGLAAELWQYVLHACLSFLSLLFSQQPLKYLQSCQLQPVLSPSGVPSASLQLLPGAGDGFFTQLCS